MIYKPGTATETTGFYGMDHGTMRDVTAVYNDEGRLIWEKAGCCYSTGAWRDELPWKAGFGWKNN